MRYLAEFGAVGEAHELLDLDPAVLPRQLGQLLLEVGNCKQKDQVHNTYRVTHQVVPTSCWHQNKSCVLVERNASFAFDVNRRWELPDGSPCA